MPLSLGRNLCVNSAERQPRSALSLGEPRSTEPNASGTGQFSPFLGRNVGKWFWGRPMAQEHRSGQIVPESGVYRVTHASAHTGVLLQVRLIKAAAFQSVRIARKSASNWRIRTKHFGEVDQRPGPNIAGTVGQRGANRATKRWSLDPAQLSAASDRPVARRSLPRS